MVKRATTELQVRGMPTALRDRLRRRVSRKGVSMSEYVIDLLKRDLERPSLAEWVEENGDFPRFAIPPGETGADLVREARREAGRGDED